MPLPHPRSELLKMSKVWEKRTVLGFGGAEGAGAGTLSGAGADALSDADAGALSDAGAGALSDAGAGVDALLNAVSGAGALTAGAEVRR